jgi:L-aspartate oxidase
MKNYNSETLSKKLFKKTEINNVTNEEIKKDFKEMKIRNDEYIGIVREKERLKKHYDYLMDLLKKYGGEPASVEEAILKNAAVVSMLITKSALIREESRGVHQRMDYPLENPDFRGHIILTDIDKHEIISVK